MEERRKRLLTAREAAGYLGISLATLNRMDKEGELMPFRTPGGHRRYSPEMLDEYLERSRQRSPPANPSIERVQNIPQGKLSDSTVRILVVDNEPHTVELITRALREDSDVYEFSSASNGYEAGVQVVAFKPNLIILSAARPEINGFEVCKSIKGHPETEHIRIIGLVGSEEDGTIEEMICCGADDCLIRPFQIEELQRSVQYLISEE
jgi:two-component system OmpR family response regulator